MSMLSAQVDELRELATRYDELQAGAVKAVTMPSDTGSVLRKAADTIWELHCKCTDLMDERERLFRTNVGKNCDMMQLLQDNAKLRKLARLLLWGIDNDMPRYEELAWTQKVNVLVRELGVEEDA